MAIQYDAPISSGELLVALQANSSLSAETLKALSAILGLGGAATVTVKSFDASNLATGGAGAQLVLVEIAGSVGQAVSVVIPPAMLGFSKAYVFNSKADIQVNFNTVERVIAMGEGNDTVTVGGDKNTTIDGGKGNDTLTTTGGNDTITGAAGNDIISSGAGNDTIVVGVGNDIVNAGSGFDIAQLAGTMADFTITKSGASLVLTGKATGSATTTLTNTEFVQLTSGSIAIVGTEKEAIALRLYQGLLDRSADSAGAQFWVNLVTTGQLSLTGAANGFMQSAEFQAAHSGLSDEAFIRLLYQSGLGRAAEQGGVTYYLQALAAGETRADIAVKIVGSPEAASVITDVQLLPGTL